MIARYKYPKASSLHNATSYKKYIQTQNGSIRSLRDFDNEILNQTNRASIKTYTMNPIRENQQRQKQNLNLARTEDVKRDRNRSKSDFILSAMEMLNTTERLKKAIAR